MVKTTGDLITADDWNNLAVVPVGAILAWPVDAAPPGWLLCAGQAVNRSEYADLFAVIGITYGAGDGGSTFNLPDLRGRFPLGKDNMGGTSANRVTATQADQLGGATGAETHTLVIAEMPSHGHDHRHLLGYNTGSTSWGPYSPLIGENQQYKDSTPQYTKYDNTLTGGGGAHNNMPPYLALNYIIKA